MQQVAGPFWKEWKKKISAGSFSRFSDKREKGQRLPAIFTIFIFVSFSFSSSFCLCRAVYIPESMGFMNPLTSYPLLDGRGWPRFRRPFHLFFSLFFLALHLVDIILVPLLHQPTRWSLFRVRCVSSFLPLLTRQKKRRRRRREKEPPEKEMNILLTFNRSSTERNQLRKKWQRRARKRDALDFSKQSPLDTVAGALWRTPGNREELWAERRKRKKRKRKENAFLLLHSFSLFWPTWSVFRRFHVRGGLQRLNCQQTVVGGWDI